MTTQALTSRYMRGATKDQMISRRDAAGDEMTALARIMHEPRPDPEEVTRYIRELLRKEHIEPQEAAAILRTVPHDPTALRGWARQMFAFVMQQGIHAHAAFPREIYPSPPQEAPAEQAAAPAANDVPTNQ